MLLPVAEVLLISDYSVQKASQKLQESKHHQECYFNSQAKTLQPLTPGKTV